MFKVGDKVAHPIHGACLVKGIEYSSAFGTEEAYYELNPMIESFTRLLVPVNRADKVGLRKAINSKEAALLIEYMSECSADTSWVSDAKKRGQILKDALRNDDMKELCGYCVTLAKRKSENGLATSDSDMFIKIRNKVLSEISMAMDTSYEAGLERFNEQLEVG